MPSFRISVTLPDMKLFDSEEFVKRIEEVQRRKTGPELKTLFLKTVDGWEHKPTFGEYHTRTPSSISTRVSTVSGIMGNAGLYALVSKGSPEHEMGPKNYPFLRFQPGYRAATKPRVIGSQRKQRLGAYVKVYHKFIHPGFEGREFDETIGEEYRPVFETDMQDAINNK